jgi:hypothetical protein
MNPKESELSDLSSLVLKALRENVESKVIEGASKWGTVYLDNVQAVSKRSLPGHLSALSEQGFYRPLDKYFGEVLMM